MADHKGNTGNCNSGVCNSGNRNTGDWNSGSCNSGNRNTGSCNSGNRNTGSCNSGSCNSGVCNSGNRNTGDWNSGSWNSGNRNTGNCNTGDWNSGSCNSGSCNSGNWNSGVFCSAEPMALFFNKPTTIKLSEFIYSEAWPDLSGMNPCVWVESSIMTTEEKKANPTHETTGGYIKKLKYKDAWAVFWRTTSEANKKKILALPNFDSAVFKDITGIDVENGNEARQKATELRKKADELLKSAEELEKSL